MNKKTYLSGVMILPAADTKSEFPMVNLPVVVSRIEAIRSGEPNEYGHVNDGVFKLEHVGTPCDSDHAAKLIAAKQLESASPPSFEELGCAFKIAMSLLNAGFTGKNMQPRDRVQMDALLARLDQIT